MRKIIIISMLIALCSIVPVCAEDTITLYEGWNLVSPLTVVNHEEYTKYILLPFENDYYEYNSDTKDDLLSKIAPYYMGGDDYFYMSSAFWVYSDEKKNIAFDIPLSVYDESFAAQSENLFKLFKGWNFISVNPYIVGKTINEYNGDCGITRIYKFNAESQEWEDLIDVEGFVEEKDLGIGLSIKVLDTCTFNLMEEDSETQPPIPALPN